MSNILIIGDVCNDVYVYGKSQRMCPDVAVPVLTPLYEKTNLGMAGNVYENAISLGAVATLKSNPILIEKRRFVEEHTNHTFLRVDSGEEKSPRINDLNLNFIQEFDLIIISDYDKGYLLKEDIQFICENHNLVFIDTKKKISDHFKGCAFLKINQYEYEDSLDYMLSNDWTKEKTIITLGNKGASYQGTVFPVKDVEIKDLCGAGDTFLAALSVRFLETQDIREAICFANECATEIVQKKGVNITSL